MILSGELPPGSVLPQAEMARRLGVSRTPMREAFRLLQEEGLIDARPDQRPRVRTVVPEDLDGVYGARIMLETLAVSVTVKSLASGDLERMGEALKRMQELAGQDRPDEWPAHKEFHGIATQAVGPQLQRMLASLGEHSERYIRLAQLGMPSSWARARTDHEALLEALRLGDPEPGGHRPGVRTHGHADCAGDRRQRPVLMPDTEPGHGELGLLLPAVHLPVRRRRGLDHQERQQQPQPGHP
ncbi:GntR family transcriptional regulator [Streptomyces sp. HUAS ZL42]|uniref:GntR family transcriptional regulator n=1 Tax=Streptomyces sp. HUAS ZL42 TaxID=3231715 RepID=UPI00345E5A9C